jgi:hypothetical protein
MSAFQKPVSTIEKLYLVFNELRPPFANQVVVGGTGRIATDALETALARATAVNPGSRLAMHGRLGRRAWVQGPPPRLTVIANSSWDGRSDAGAPFLDRPLDPAGPTCELQVVEAGAQTFLIFRSLHGVMDGVGTLYWAQDVLRALRGEALLGHESDWTDTRFAAGLTQDTLALPPRDALHPCGRADAPTGDDFQWRRITIEAPTDAPLVAALAVTLAAEARKHGAGPVRFNIPADLRFFHKDQRSTGNVIGTLFVDVAPEATVGGLAQELKDRLRAREHARFPASYERLRWVPMALLRGMIRRGFATEHTTGRYGLTATLSFLGTVDPDAMAAPGFTPTTTFWIPPTADQSCFVACDRFGTRLELALALPRVLGSNGRFEELLARLEAVVTA